MQWIYLISSALVLSLLLGGHYNLMHSTPEITNMKIAKNVFGEELKLCCTDPLTGYYRDGFCNTGMDDRGSHVVCAVMTQEFLDFTKSRGNDLCTPVPAYRFPGLKVGDKWCLCALRWREAMLAGVAPPVVLASTHQKALQYVRIKDLEAHSQKQD